MPRNGRFHEASGLNVLSYPPRLGQQHTLARPFPRLDVPCKIVPAPLLNDAGIVAAALAAAL